MQIRRFALAWLLAFAWMGLIFYLSDQSRPLAQAPPAAVSYAIHFGEYAVLATLLFWALLASGWKRDLAVVLGVAFAVSALYAASDEYHQSFVAGRDASAVDFAMDVVGAAFAVAVTGRWGRPLLLRRERYRRRALPADPRRDPP